MAEEQPQPTPQEAVWKLTPSDINAFFASANVRSECPSCGKNGWQMYSPESDGIGYVPLQMGKDRPLFADGKTVPVILLICLNCAFVRPHSALLIARWKTFGKIT